MMLFVVHLVSQHVHFQYGIMCVYIRRPLAAARGARERRYEFSWCGGFEHGLAVWGRTERLALTWGRTERLALTDGWCGGFEHALAVWGALGAACAHLGAHGAACAHGWCFLAKEAATETPQTAGLKRCDSFRKRKKELAGCCFTNFVMGSESNVRDSGAALGGRGEADCREPWREGTSMALRVRVFDGLRGLTERLALTDGVILRRRKLVRRHRQRD